MESELKTADIYLTAYLLSHNISYKRIISEGCHRKKVVFIFPTTKPLTELAIKYRRKEAVVNVTDFMHGLERARDVIFSTLRS